MEEGTSGTAGQTERFTTEHAACTAHGGNVTRPHARGCGLGVVLCCVAGAETTAATEHAVAHARLEELVRTSSERRLAAETDAAQAARALALAKVGS